MTDRDAWHFGGRYYGLTWAGSLDAETTDAELDDLAPAPERGCVARVVFTDNASREPMFVQHAPHGLPLALVEQFIHSARNGQPTTSG